MDLLGLNKHMKYLLEQECVRKWKTKVFTMAVSYLWSGGAKQ